jgi:hypothetical protein
MVLGLGNSAPLASTPVWARDFASPQELITEFSRECRIVRKGLDGDLKKAMKDGKPVIIEVHDSSEIAVGLRYLHPCKHC